MSVSIPAPPFRLSLPAPPVMTLARVLPVPLKLPVPTKVRFSTLLLKVKLFNVVLTVSVPAPAASVTTSVAESTR